jgi:D-alanine-D-alanine ligase
MRRLVVACVVDQDVAPSLQRGAATTDFAAYDLSVVQTLRQLYRDVHVVSADAPCGPTVERLVRLQPDVVFNLAFSATTMEAPFAGCLEAMGLRYTGSGPLGIALANDKSRSRRLLAGSGVHVPRFVDLEQGARSVVTDLTPPFIVKPVSLGGSSGIYSDSVVSTHRDVLQRARRIWRRFGVAAVCDEFVAGRELRVVVVESPSGWCIAGVLEWHFGRRDRDVLFRYEAIRDNKAVRRARQVKARRAVLPRPVDNALRDVAIRAVRVLGLRGYASLDVRIDSRSRLVVLEVNANPGLNATSKIWDRMSFERSIQCIVSTALSTGHPQ